MLNLLFLYLMKHRIQGLEAQCAVLIMTSNCLHLLNGFRIRPNSQKTQGGSSSSSSGHGSNHSNNATLGDKSLEFMGSGFSSAAAVRQHQPTSSSLSSPQVAASEATMQGYGFIGRQMAEEQRWVNEIWEDLLGHDFGYVRMMLHDVRKTCPFRYIICDFCCFVLSCLCSYDRCVGLWNNSSGIYDI